MGPAVLASAPVLSLYDATKPTVVSADASSYGFGGFLLQQHGEDWKPVDYCSRTEGPLMNSKDLDKVPIRCQRLRMRLMRFNIEALAMADALSRGPVQNFGDKTSSVDVAAHKDPVLSHVPAMPQRMQEITDHTTTNPQVQVVRRFIQSGWPAYEMKIPETVRDFCKVREELSEADGSVVRSELLIVL